MVAQEETGQRLEAVPVVGMCQRSLLRLLDKGHQGHHQAIDNHPLCKKPVTYACCLRLTRVGVVHKTIAGNQVTSLKLLEPMPVKSKSWQEILVCSSSTVIFKNQI